MEIPDYRTLPQIEIDVTCYKGPAWKVNDIWVIVRKDHGHWRGTNKDYLYSLWCRIRLCSGIRWNNGDPSFEYAWRAACDLSKLGFIDFSEDKYSVEFMEEYRAVDRGEVSPEEANAKVMMLKIQRA